MRSMPQAPGPCAGFGSEEFVPLQPLACREIRPSAQQQPAFPFHQIPHPQALAKELGAATSSSHDSRPAVVSVAGSRGQRSAPARLQGPSLQEFGISDHPNQQALPPGWALPPR